MDSEKSRAVTLNSRSVRVAIAFGLTFVLWLICTARLHHRCALGYKFFEDYGSAFVGALGGAFIVYVRRLWLGSLVSLAIAFAFCIFAIPSYLAWIHGPNHPRFPAEDAQEARLQKELRLIDEAISRTDGSIPANSPGGH